MPTSVEAYLLHHSVVDAMIYRDVVTSYLSVERIVG